MTEDARSKMTAREYAASLNLAKMGKGRLSPAAHAAIKAAEAEGVTFKLPAHVIAAQEREKNGPKRNRRPAMPVPTSPRSAADKHSADDRHPHADISEWFKANFGFGSFVRNPQGKTMRVTSEFPDVEGYTHFVDEAGKRFKAIVNGQWGTSKGWPVKKGYTPNNER